MNNFADLCVIGDGTEPDILMRWNLISYEIKYPKSSYGDSGQENGCQVWPGKTGPLTLEYFGTKASTIDKTDEKYLAQNLQYVSNPDFGAEQKLHQLFC